jgi:hypothetical protein
MPVRLTLAEENDAGQFGGFIASDIMMNSDKFTPECGRMQNYKDDIWSRNEWGMPLTNFAAPRPGRGTPSPRPAKSWASPDFHEQRGHGRVPGFQGRHDERSHASSEETQFFPDDPRNNDPFPGVDYSESTGVGGFIELEKIYEEYLAEGVENAQGEIGVTIMLRDIPYKMQVEPHVFDLLENISDLNYVDYIYLPMSEPHQGPEASRNKGYCFIHFSNKATAHLFVSRLEHYVLPTTVFPASKMMTAGLAKFQGLSLNLRNLLDIQSKKWRPKKGHAHIRRAGGMLAPIGLLRLRQHFKQRVRTKYV